MAAAEVGDDVYGEDPTVNALERHVAQLLRKEAALFVPSGTMANLIAAITHCTRRGSEMVVGDESHIYYYEQGGASSLGGVAMRVLPNQPDGTIRLADLQHALRPANVHYATTALVCLENTHNRCGGRVLPMSYVSAVGAFCRENNIKLHLDGARLMNAVVELGVPAHEAVADFDSISLCLSKGLGAPVGSVLVGTASFIAEARRARKALGGGMRQAGVLAAAGLYALEHIYPLLAKDHTRARALAGRLRTIGGGGWLKVDEKDVQTNIIYVTVENAADVTARMQTRGVLLSLTDPLRFRICTHHQVSDDDVRAMVEAFEQVHAELHKKSKL
eukprot:TRINITY_DN9796_c0_g1_i1.p1 TRINITY_DN9796_c0_g1~~TRINITY_DN9796_c0_g1_i1.p1  ORF type:complete len:358 (-),score=98.58 TRINITY_DN9796_c0_g1_i1:74-1069(-)